MKSKRHRRIHKRHIRKHIRRKARKPRKAFRLFWKRRKRPKIIVRRKEKHKHKATHPFLITLMTIAFLLGMILTIYSFNTPDINTTALGLVVMFFALAVTLMSSNIIKKRKHKPKPKIIKHRERFRIKFRLPFRSIAYSFVFLLTIFSAVYFLFFQKDFFLLIISIVAAFVALGGAMGAKLLMGAKSRRRTVREESIHLLKSRREKAHIERAKPRFSLFFGKRHKIHVRKKIGKNVFKQEKKQKAEERKAIKIPITKLQRTVKEKLKNLDRSKTPLDVFYWLLQQKKKLYFSDIPKIFNIDIKGVEVWAKILESHDLAIIDYPAFGSPIIRLKKKESEEEIE